MPYVISHLWSLKGILPHTPLIPVGLAEVLSVIIVSSFL